MGGSAVSPCPSALAELVLHPLAEGSAQGRFQRAPGTHPSRHLLRAVPLWHPVTGRAPTAAPPLPHGTPRQHRLPPPTHPPASSQESQHPPGTRCAPRHPWVPQHPPACSSPPSLLPRAPLPAPMGALPGRGGGARVPDTGIPTWCTMTAVMRPSSPSYSRQKRRGPRVSVGEGGPGLASPPGPPAVPAPSGGGQCPPTPLHPGPPLGVRPPQPSHGPPPPHSHCSLR